MGEMEKILQKKKNPIETSLSPLILLFPFLSFDVTLVQS